MIGQHNGLADYTIGQRKGLGVQAIGPSAEPLYVLSLDTSRNALIVGTLAELGADRLTAARVSWVAGNPPTEPICAQVKIRYKAKPVPATITPLPNARIAVQFDDPVRDVTPGQGAVVYDGDVVLGGGIIERRKAVE
jgi:tRNA-specific 2-thiouridylase